MIKLEYFNELMYTLIKFNIFYNELKLVNESC